MVRCPQMLQNTAAERNITLSTENGKSGLERLYEWLWTRAGGKPWTEIVQEDQKRNPLLYLIIFLLLGIMVAKLTGRRWWWIVLAVGLGVLVGHFWW